MIEEESGIHCGKVQTIMLRLPGNKSNTPAGWTVQAKLSIFLWLGVIQNRQFCYSALPKGFDLSPEIRNAERPGALAPSNIHYLEKHVLNPISFRTYRIKKTNSSCLFSLLLSDISTSRTSLSSTILDWFRRLWFK